MKLSVLALSSAALTLAVADARAQSLSDAINQALAPLVIPPAAPGGNPTFINCDALGAGVPRFRTTWQSDDRFTTNPEVTITNDEAGTVVIVPPPEDVTDGLGRQFRVQPSNFPSLDPAVAQGLSESELLDLFFLSGVQNLTIDSFAAGNFGPGLNGLCQGVAARTNSNGNNAGAGGFAGGSSSASGRSVSSLSSAREQSSKEKKRKKKKRDRNSSYDDGFIRLASNDEGLGLVADAAGAGPFDVKTFVDLRGGYTDIDRDATVLESGFDGRSLWGQGTLSAEVSDSFALAGSFSYSRARGEFDTASASGGANEFRERNLTGGLFAIFSAPISNELALDIAVGGFYGAGSGDIERTFSASRATAYTVDVFVDPTNPGAGDVTIDLLRTSAVADDLLGEFDTRNYGFSAAASVSVPVGGFTVTPGVEFTWFSFKQDDYDESVSDTFNNGLALSYSEFKDRWTETRLGGAIARDFGGLRLEGYGDLVLTGGAETPVRTATFVEDLRPDPYVLTYRVDDLDKAFGVFGLVAAVGIGEGIEAFVGGETNAAHEYLTTRTIFAGVRFRP